MSKIILGLLVFVAFASLASAKGNLVCYFPSWSIYREGNGKFGADDVDAKLCTHILYAFVGLNSDGTVKVLDDWELNGLGELKKLQNLKSKNPKLKLLVSMGGWSEGSKTYSNVAKSSSLRSKLVKNVISFVKKYKFDGFDLDWEYPAQRGGSSADKKNYVQLLKQLKAALSKEKKLLSAAVGAGASLVDDSYLVSQMSKYLDMINVMTYDFHSADEGHLGHNAPLKASSLDKSSEAKQLNVEAAIKYWIKKGAPPKKINLGLATYGRSFTLSDPKKVNLYDKSKGPGKKGPYTQEDGLLGYNEICELHKDWKYVWDNEQKVPHKYHGNQWVGYDDEKSLKEKVKFLKSMKLGGAMFWSLDTDDTKGVCGGKKFPLVNAVKQALGN